MFTNTTMRRVSGIGFAALTAIAGCASDGEPTRSLPACGDTIVDLGEVCDDGNTADGDGCSALCDSDETCGNLVVDLNETCDDGNTADGDACRANCGVGLCGDGTTDPSERCDDADDSLGAHCSADCRICDWDVGSISFPIAVTSSNGFGDVIFDVDCNLLVSGGYLDTINLITPAGDVSIFASGYTSNASLGLAYELASATLYVSTDAPDELWSIDTLGAAEKVMDLPTIINDLEFAPAGFGDNGGELFGVGADGNVYLIDLAATSSSVFGSTTGQLASLAFAPDGSMLYVANYGGSVLEEVDSSGTFSEFVTTLSGIDGLAMDPSGDRLIVMHRQGGETLSEITLPAGLIMDGGSPQTSAGFYVTGLVMDGSGDVLIKGFNPIGGLPSVESYTF